MNVEGPANDAACFQHRIANVVDVEYEICRGLSTWKWGERRGAEVLKG